MALNTTVAATPRANTTIYGKHFRLKPLFANRKLKKFIFFSEYGGYLALKYTQNKLKSKYFWM
jgi:hypothetical protein